MLDWVKKFEGFSSKAYTCPAGALTIGYGHTDGVKAGQHITAAEADALLRQDMARVESQVTALAQSNRVTLTQGRFDALCSFVFNLGIGSLKGSTLWRKAKANVNDPTIAAEFGRWVYAAGKRLKGLENRRQVEADFWRGGGL